MPHPLDRALPVPRDARAPGINIRTYIATQAMAGIMTQRGIAWATFEEHQKIAKAAVGMADALIKELNR